MASDRVAISERLNSPLRHSIFEMIIASGAATDRV